MADEHDAKVSAAYRALGAEEPPRALDEAILAAARRPSDRPARSWSRRWAVPLSLAAVLVLSVTVTLRIQHERPGIESPAPVAREAVREKARQTASAPGSDEKASPKAQPQSRPAPRKEPVPFPPAPRDQTTAAAASPATAPAAASARSEERMSRDAEAAPVQALAKRSAPMAASAPAARGTAVAETPERELERIAGLRRDEKHDEADKALAEFRKRYPDYRIPDLMLERVERR